MRDRLRKRLEDRTVAFAIAHPSVEGWMQADLAALKRGLAKAIGSEVSLPRDCRAYPETEQEAKNRLRYLVTSATGARALGGGVEYGPFVMAHAAWQPRKPPRAAAADDSYFRAAWRTRGRRLSLRSTRFHQPTRPALVSGPHPGAGSVVPARPGRRQSE